MNRQTKINTAKMLSLIDRMESRGTNNEGMLNESMHIDEAISKNRVQVTRDQIIDILDQQDAKGNGGKFASITYVKPETVYKTKKSWRDADVTDALSAHMDKSGEEWYKNITAYNQPDAKGKNPIGTVIAVQRYTLHWTRQESYDKAYGVYSDALRNLRMRSGVAIPTDGVLGDNHNQRQDGGYGNTKFSQAGNLQKDFNMAGVKPKSTCYVVDDNGNISYEIPDNVIKSMMAQNVAKPEKDVAAVLSGPALDAYMEAKKELAKTFRGQTLLFDRILCIAANVDGQSYYYINDMLKTPIAQKSDVNVNPQAMIKIAEEQLDASFDGIQGFEN